MPTTSSRSRKQQKVMDKISMVVMGTSMGKEEEVDAAESVVSTAETSVAAGMTVSEQGEELSLA